VGDRANQNHTIPREGSIWGHKFREKVKKGIFNPPGVDCAPLVAVAGGSSVLLLVLVVRKSRPGAPLSIA
jgi:hypothetical protein